MSHSRRVTNGKLRTFALAICVLDAGVLVRVVLQQRRLQNLDSVYRITRSHIGNVPQRTALFARLASHGLLSRTGYPRSHGLIAQTQSHSRVYPDVVASLPSTNPCIPARCTVTRPKGHRRCSTGNGPMVQRDGQPTSADVHETRSETIVALYRNLFVQLHVLITPC